MRLEHSCLILLLRAYMNLAVIEMRGAERTANVSSPHPQDFVRCTARLSLGRVAKVIDLREISPSS